MKTFTYYNKTNTIYLFLFFAMLFFSKHSFSQELLIQESTTSFTELSTAEQTRLAKIQAKDMYTDYYLADWGALIDLQSEGEVAINLPDDDCAELIYQARSVQYTDEGNYSWYGILKFKEEDEDCYCLLGAMTLISSEHGRIGHIIIDDKTYELLELSPEKMLLAKLDSSKFTESECGVNHAVSTNEDTYDREKAQDRDNGNCDVRCLVLYTNNARNTEGSITAINNRVNLAIHQTNQALRNSDVDRCQLKIELVGVQFFDFEEGSNDMGEDIRRFRDNDLDEVNALLDLSEADIVILMTDGDYGGTFGVAFVGPNDELPIALVETGAATTGRFTFAHEVAHLFGAQHDDSPVPGIPHGHNFKTGNFLPCIFGARQRTILNRAGNNDIRIQHYSNPDVEYDDKKTGKENKRDNAQQLRNTACIVAQFRTTEEPFSLSIGGDAYACPCMGAYIEADLFGGTAGATYDYTWFMSDDGINWNSLPYSGANALVTVPCTEGEGVFVRIDVAGSDGNTGSNTTFIQAAMEWAGQEAPCPLLTDPDPSNNRLTIYPNPSTNQINIEFQAKMDGVYSILLKDINGKLVEPILQNEYLKLGFYHYIVEPKQAGLFFIHYLDAMGNSHIQKLLKF